MKADSPKTKVVPVLVPMPAERAYSYTLPDGIDAPPGSIVRVPLGPRQVAGIVWDSTVEQLDPKKLRPIEQVFDCPPIDAPMRRFVDWVASYTLTPPGLVARMLLRAPEAFDPEPWIAGLQRTEHQPDRLTDARRRVLELTDDGLAWTRSGIAHAAGVSSAVIDGLRAQGVFEPTLIPPRPVVAVPDPDYAAPDLAGEQREAGEALRGAIAKGGFSVTLLDGVTGSGKTEVYFEAVAAALEQGKQVLILLPEIALTQAFLDRFHDRFGAKPAEWHSDLPPRMREKVWRQTVEGSVRVVAGARSALFLPFKDLGLIVVDEEHDPAYKQEDRVFYNARDMAIVRAHIAGFPVVLASATPSVESRVNATSGRYGRVALPARYADAALPDIKAIDMRRAPPARGGFLSPILLGQVRETVAKGEQALLFLNRRGYAPLTLCRVCGHRFQCPDCSSWLVEHRFRGQLVCHHCGHNERRPDACPECGTFDHLVACGPGVERIAEEVVGHFPEARTLVLSSDILGGVKRLRLELEAVANGEADIVIGTQLVAKGHNFPNMTLVGVVDADLGLANGDPRAAERTFQLLSQVTGRAGRTGKKSLGLLQTYQPDHPVMRAIVSGDSESFYDREIAERERAALPPFGRLAGIIVSADNRADAEGHARGLRRAAPQAADIFVLGPAEAPLALVGGRHRFRLLVHGERKADMQGFIRAMLAEGPKVRRLGARECRHRPAELLMRKQHSMRLDKRRGIGTSMKTLGLIGGMSWESTAIYYRLINEGVREHLGGLHSAKLLLWSFDFAEIAERQHADDWAGATAMMVEAARKLEAGGAEALVICTNTMHKMADDVQAQVSAPIIHIADATAEAMKAAGVSHPLLLATRFTMEQDFYKGRLADKHGIAPIIPDATGRDGVHRIIYEELVRGIVTAPSREIYLAEVARARTDNPTADGLIMGCTEITMLIGQGDFDIPVFDTTAIHAQAAVDFALG